MHLCLLRHRPQKNLEKFRDIKSPVSITQEDPSQSPNRKFTEKPKSHVEAKPMCLDHSSQGQEPQPPAGWSSSSTRNQFRWEGGSRQETCGREERKKAVGNTKQKQPLEGEKKAAATKNPAAQKPTEKKPTTEEKKPAHKLDFFYSMKFKLLWTANFE